MVEMGEDIARSACCRVGLVKSSYKEISSNILRPSEVNTAYSSCKTRLVLLDMDLLRPSKEEMEDGGDIVWQQVRFASFLAVCARSAAVCGGRASIYAACCAAVDGGSAPVFAVAAVSLLLAAACCRYSQAMLLWGLAGADFR
eukprot:2050392-Rhodomonas_salina.2